jgi:phenylalanyl-tRNA synthetase alpha chain
LHEYETKILKLLKEKGASSLEGIEKSLGIDTGSVTWALDSLAKSGAVKVTKAKAYSAAITDEGKGYLGSFPEEELARSIGSGGRERLDSIKSGVGLIWAKRNGWIETDKDYVKLTRAGADATAGKAAYAQRAVLNSIANADEKDLGEVLGKNKDVVDVLVKRGLLKFKEKDRIIDVEITGKGVDLSRAKPEDGIGDLTREIILSKSWMGKEFKKYDVNASSETRYPARPHVMHEFIDMVRSAWMSMGFSEMDGPIVENAFWVFDALFSPQDHPTRDMQDTFFLSNPKQIDIEDIEAMSRIKKAHEKGWGEEWREEMAKQALLRTHTTSVSVRHIRKFAQAMEGSYPVKLFSVGRVYRNESIDYKHLAELYQTDGIIIGNHLTVANLIDTLKRFLSQLGFDNIGIKPAYFPFVEPGIEIYFRDEKRGSTMELGGAGVIRREITKAMGTNKTVLAWGIGVERLLMHSFEVDSITDLRRNDIGWLRERAELKI